MSESFGLEGNQEVRLCPIGEASSIGTGELELSYLGKVMTALSRMGERERNQLELVLTAAARQRRGLCGVYGLWMDSGKEVSQVYLVSERMRHGLSDAMADGWSWRRSDGDKLFAAMVGLESCEAILSLQAHGIICGCLTISCVCFDVLGHCVLDLSEVLMTRRRLQLVVDHGSGTVGAFVSPEALGLLCGVVACSTGDDSSSGYEMGYGSDVWSVASILAMLLIGVSSVDRLQLEGFFLQQVRSRKDLEHHYIVWMEKISSELEVSLLGNRFEPLLQVLRSCFSYDPVMRPALSELWTCLKGLLFPSQKHLFCTANLPTAKEDPVCYLLRCDLVPIAKGCRSLDDNLSATFVNQDSGAKLLETNQADGKESQEDNESGDLTKGLEADKTIYGGYLQHITLQGHRDCITGLTVGGGFLYTSSFDKTIIVWSLKDFSIVQTLRGHEHRITAVVAVESSQLQCISADSGGFLFVWVIRTPVEQGPLKIWREHNDWRFSGVHSLAASGCQYLYTGSGDKTIKAWSLQDFSLVSTMTGHTSTVSSLVTCNGILYSGSWDGTIRLWWLDDHTPLAVLGNDFPGNGFSVLSLSVHNDLIAASYENGFIKMWRNGELIKSEKNQSGALFAVHMDKKLLVTGGWEKIVNVQEISENKLQLELRPVGCIQCESVVTSILQWQRWLFVGTSDKYIKVYHCNP